MRRVPDIEVGGIACTFCSEQPRNELICSHLTCFRDEIINMGRLTIDQAAAKTHTLTHIALKAIVGLISHSDHIFG